MVKPVNTTGEPQLLKWVQMKHIHNKGKNLTLWRCSCGMHGLANGNQVLRNCFHQAIMSSSIETSVKVTTQIHESINEPSKPKV
ncbi:hypothetical protein Fmac_001732 [Flemingia macrophylla]|uniref:Uncharacterized protein n=1 Tax=Flemingia macrophylla TaxID=520843 RepID=A0ABD1NJ85_9FABA